MRGILPDNPATFRSNAQGGVLDPQHPVAKAIDERVSRIKLEISRAGMAQMLSDLLYDDIKAETDRAYGSKSTRESYTLDFNKFREWCIGEGLSYLPTSPEIVAHYVVAHGEMRPERLARATSAIAYVHSWADLPYRSDDVLVKAAMRFVRRCHEQEQERRTEAATQLPDAANGAGQQH